MTVGELKKELSEYPDELVVRDEDQHKLLTIELSSYGYPPLWNGKFYEQQPQTPYLRFDFY